MDNRPTRGLPSPSGSVRAAQRLRQEPEGLHGDSARRSGGDPTEVVVCDWNGLDLDLPAMWPGYRGRDPGKTGVRREEPEIRAPKGPSVLFLLRREGAWAVIVYRALGWLLGLIEWRLPRWVPWRWDLWLLEWTIRCRAMGRGP